MRTFELAELGEREFLGDYQILDVLGRGPIGTTYQVISNVLQKEFAVKTLLIGDELSIPWLEKLEAQTTLLSKLTHRNIDTIINSGRSKNFWFCVKDFIHNGAGSSCSLADYTAEFGGTLSHYQTCHLALQICQGMGYAANYRDGHHTSIHHGNLKPENILIAYSTSPQEATTMAPFEVKISDFQPYNLFSAPTLGKLYTQWEKTLTNYPTRSQEKAIPQVLAAMYRGFDYTAPELKASGKATVSCDIFSVGVLLYEALTGRLPVGRFPKPSELRQDIPESWDDLLLNCLEQRADCRPLNFEDLGRFIESELFNQEMEQPPVAENPKKQGNKEKPRERLSLTPAGMIYIPAGTFFIGSAECGQDALPQHEVESNGFYMDRTSVTNAHFAKFVQETDYITEAEEGEGAPIWIDGEWKLIPGINWRNPDGKKVPEDFEQHPVTQVTFADAEAYCEWAGRRLPTEIEWEQAARGGLAAVKFPWGDTISRVQANYSTDGTTPVMSYQANGYGLYDIAGNVWEWTSSWYQAYPGNHQKSIHFGEKYRVVRGGAWIYDGAHCMVSYRNANDPLHAYPTVGFRTVVDFECKLPKSS
jgi:sulfatase modifying factor 1